MLLTSQFLTSYRNRLTAAAIAAGAMLVGVSAHGAPSGFPSPAIHETIDATQLTVLEGNTRPETRHSVDLGVVDDSLPLGHMFLQLKRSAEREAALEDYVNRLHDPKSSEFHHWLTPAQFAEHYGVDSQDLATVKSWLEAQGFKVHGATPTGLVIDFSGYGGSSTQGPCTPSCITTTSTA